MKKQMGLPLPEFAKGPEVDAVAEFRTLITQVGADAVHLLAELVEVNNGVRPPGPRDESNTKIRGLYCRRLSGGMVFYTFSKASSVPKVKVLLAVTGASFSFPTLEMEAGRRMRRVSHTR